MDEERRKDLLWTLATNSLPLPLSSRPFAICPASFHPRPFVLSPFRPPSLRPRPQNPLAARVEVYPRGARMPRLGLVHQSDEVRARPKGVEPRIAGQRRRTVKPARSPLARAGPSRYRSRPGRPARARPAAALPGHGIRLDNHCICLTQSSLRPSIAATSVSIMARSRLLGEWVSTSRRA